MSRIDRYDEEEKYETVVYYILRTPGGAVAQLLDYGGTLFYLSGMRGWEANYAVSHALARHIEALAKRYRVEINKYANQRGNYLYPFPWFRAVVGYLEENGLLEFNGEKVEAEDVGPPFVCPKLPPFPSDNPDVVA